MRNMILIHIRLFLKRCPCLECASVNSKTPENMARLTAEERESYWYGAVGCELCPCGKNPKLHKINDHQVDTALQGDW